MDRRAPILVAAVAALLTSGACQDYNFNPVGHCVIQPGTRRVTLSNISSADVLFVVDDSGSMLGEQANLAGQFSAFINVLNTANAERVANDLDPIDFHLAITTTSMFRSPNLSVGSTCENDCSGAVGSKVCCLGSGSPQPPYCKSNSDCATGFSCLTSAQCGAAAAVGGQGCFDGAPSCVPQTIGCSTIGEDCSNVQHFYATFAGCTPAYADNHFGNDEYPMGRFMAPTGNPLVLHFDKDLYCTWDDANQTCTGPVADPAGATAAINALITDFGENVALGTCGSNQEQGLEAARAAIERARGQRGGQPTGTGYAGLSDFLHPDAKLVVVWVTDEDDCSSPADPSSAVVFWQTASSDGCRADAALPPADQREYSAGSVADYFTGLGRPFAAAMVASFLNGCDANSCSPGLCCDYACTGSASVCTSSTCGGQGIPSRYLALATELQGRGTEVVLGSVCDQFGGPGGTLDRVAQIVKPPAGLELPTLPAAGEVTILRIAKSDGTTRKTCYGPAPAAMDAAAAAAAGYDWWFTATRDQATAAQKDPTTASTFIYINHATQSCEANPGETYSADYLGQLPAATATTPGGCLVDADCSNAMGGSPGDWTCFAGYANTSTLQCAALGGTRGTCVCGARTSTCPGGSL